jgi:stage V sporulation protein SpoVS
MFSRLDPDQETEGLILVSGTTTPQSLAFAIQGYIFNDFKMPTIRAIGAGAVAQTCKGVAIARGYVAVRGVDLGCAIGFDNVPGDDGGEISAQTFRLFMR